MSSPERAPDETHGDDALAGRRKAVLYARVSSKEQEEEGFSIPAQTRLLRGYAAENEIAVVEEFVDVETAKHAGRTNFNRMISFLQRRKTVRAILVEKTDRLYRNFRDYVTLDDLDVEIHLVKEGAVLSHGSRSHEKFIHGIKVLMAKNYIDNLSEETRKGLAEKAARGWLPRSAPVGYSNVDGPDGKRIVVPDPKTAPFVRDLFRSYAKGDVSLENLRERCIAAGFKAGWGERPIARGKIAKILRNPFYIGLFRWNGRVYEGAHEPIVSREVFDRVREVLDGRRKTREKKRHRRDDIAFGGVLKCGVCGCAVTGEIKKGGLYVLYRCTNYHGGCTETRYHREADLSRQFDEIVRSIVMDGPTVEWLKDALKDSLEDETEYHRSAVAGLNERLDIVKRRLNKAYLEKLDGKITDAFWADLSSGLQEEKSQILGQLARHESADTAYLEQGVRIFDLARRAPEIYHRSKPAEKRHLLGLLLSNCTLAGGRVTATYRPPFDTVAVMAAEARRRSPAEMPAAEACTLWGPQLDAVKTGLRIWPEIKDMTERLLARIAA